MARKPLLNIVDRINVHGVGVAHHPWLSFPGILRETFGTVDGLHVDVLSQTSYVAAVP